MSPNADIRADEVCPPCRGSGEIVSNLGGEPHRVECPWCHGTGRLPRPGTAAD